MNDQISSQIKNQTFILSKLSIPVNPIFIPVAVKCAKEVSTLLKFNQFETIKVQMAVEEAVKNVIDHYSTSTGMEDTIDLRFILKDYSLVISVYEKGIPFKSVDAIGFSVKDLGSFENSGLGLHVLNSLMDGVDHIMHGRMGKETRLTKRLSNTEVALELSEINASKVNRGQRKKVNDYTIRRATVDDIPEIIRLAWRCYGYTQEDLIYNPDSLETMLLNEEIISFVAVNSEDSEFICHIALKYHDLKVPEMGLAFADQNYRCPGIMVKLGSFIFDFSRERGDDGVFDCSVTTHTFSQKDMQEIGSRPCSLLMGIAATGMQPNMTGINKQEKGSTMNHYISFNKKKEVVYVPLKHKEIIHRIYEWQNLPRVIEVSEGSNLSGNSEVFLVPLPKELNVAFIIVGSIGEETANQINAYMQKCIKEKMDACYLFMTLQDRNSPAIVMACEKLGFTFAGIMPHIQNGQDRILMQKLNIDIDPAKIRVYSENSRELLDYILNEIEISK